MRLIITHQLLGTNYKQVVLNIEDIEDLRAQEFEVYNL